MPNSSCAIVIPCYCDTDARLAYFDACLSSVESQSVPVLCIVVDDDSPRRAEVERIVEAHGASSDLRYVAREKPAGEAHSSSGALNLALALALGLERGAVSAAEAEGIRALGYLHCDDLLPVHSVETRLPRAMRGFSWGLQLVLREVDGTYEPWDGGILDYSCSKPHFTHHTALWSAPLVREAFSYARARYGQEGVFDTSLSSYEDWEASITMAECARRLSMEGAYIDEYVYYYRTQHGGISERTSKEEMHRITRAILDKHGLDESFVTPPSGKGRFPRALLSRMPEGLKTALKGARDRALRRRPRPYAFPAGIGADPLLAGYRPAER